MIRFSFFILCSILFSLDSISQGFYPMGSRSMSMANASVAIEDVWGYHNNPAVLAGIESVQIGLSYENRFLTKEMQSQGFALAIPLKKGVLSIGGNGFGYSQLRTYKCGVGYSMKLAEFIQGGIQLNYQTIRINPVYGNSHDMTAEIGVLTTLNQKTKIGVSIFNLGRSTASTYQYDRYTTCIRFGFNYKIAEEVSFNSEIEKDIEHPLRIKNGFEYEPVSNFFLRGGFVTEPVELTFGCGYHLKQKFSFNTGFSYSNLLGWSPNLSFEYGL